MNNSTPINTRIYLNHHLDSTRWKEYEPRQGDTIVTTSYKSGTSWMLQILTHLLYGDEKPLPDFHKIAPYVDGRFPYSTQAELHNLLKSLKGRRILKSHLPLDGLPYYPEVRYIIVARDTRDVFMSLFNHISSYTEFAYSQLNAPGAPSDPFPPCPSNPREFWQKWINQGWFDWESEGYPMWSNLHHTQTYWNYKCLPNFLFMHFNDMLSDLRGAVKKIAHFIQVELTEERLQQTVDGTTFKNVRKKIDATPKDDNDLFNKVFRHGRKSFFFRGSNGHWRDVLTAEDLEDYEKAKKRVLTLDCAAWLEKGGEVSKTVELEPVGAKKNMCDTAVNG